MKKQFSTLILLFFSICALAQNYSAIETEVDKMADVINTVFWVIFSAIVLFGILMNSNKLYQKEYVDFIKSLVGYLIAAVLIRVLYSIVSSLTF